MVMSKDSGTKCSHCGKNGHNSRTCTDKTGTKTVRLFGVKINNSPPYKREDPMKKSRSMGNLHTIDSEYMHDDGDRDLIGRGYLSDGPVRSRKDGHERKKGVPWTAEEHRTFLEGLKKLGKGDWRGISRNYVTTRTPAQVASHAQKYFIRQAAATKKKRRLSLFDMEISEPGESTETNPTPTSNEIENYSKKTVPCIVNQFSSLGMQSSPPTASLTRTRSFPSFSGIPYMVGTPRGDMGYMKPQGFQTVSVMPVVNICNVGYGYQPRPVNGFSCYAPVMSRPYLNPFSSTAAPNCTPQVEPHGSSTVSTDLNLSIAPPGLGDRAKLPTHSSNMNGAIGVI